MSDDRPSVAGLQNDYRVLDSGTSKDIQDAIDGILEATPVLLEIVAAALAYRKAKKIAARTRERLARMNFPDDLSRECEVLDNEELRCRGAFVAALAMVRE